MMSGILKGGRGRAPLTLCLALMVSLAAGAGGDTFRLADGKFVRGELLKERADSFVVDLGFEVVVIPKKLVQEHLTGDQAAPPATPVVSAPPITMPAPERPSAAGTLYSTSGQQASGVRDAAQKFGPAVVTVSTPDGLGSGFVVDEAGHVVTNAHVIHGETRITLTVFLLPKAAAGAGPGAKEAAEGQAAKEQVPEAPTGSETPLERRKVEQVRIVAIDPFLDLALLQAQELNTLGVPHVYLGDSDLVRVGQEVFAIGAPLGLERSVSSGIVSSTQRNLGGILYVQTTAAINPGNSGGPLFDTQGRVIGVINAKVFGAEGVGFAIPIFYLRHFLDHQEAFAYDKDNPNTGYHYLSPAGVVSLERSGPPAPAGRAPEPPEPAAKTE
jgi:serine protease Do